MKHRLNSVRGLVTNKFFYSNTHWMNKVESNSPVPATYREFSFEKKLSPQILNTFSINVETNQASNTVYKSTTNPKKLALNLNLPPCMASTYVPAQIEGIVQQAWEEWYQTHKALTNSHLNESDVPNWSPNCFAICLPPINITGHLHLGHALTCAIQDCIVRWNRMRNFDVRWLPGFDHAGIATEVRVELHLKRKSGEKGPKLDRLTLGRKEFIDRVHQWKREKIQVISGQLRKMGLCMEWPLDANYYQFSDIVSKKPNNHMFDYPFTLDHNFRKVVQGAFQSLDSRGLIYRSQRLVNWCCHLRTAISDLEVQKIRVNGPTIMSLPDYQADANTKKFRRVKFGQIWAIRYPLYSADNSRLLGNSPSYLTVHTTRPETIMNDVALAVNPNDTRFPYYNVQGLKVLHPLSEYYKTPKFLPVIYDARVDPHKGSGILKVSPAHDVLDYEIYHTHLNKIHDTTIDADTTISSIFCDDGTIRPGLYGEGTDRFHARLEILSYLSTRTFESHSNHFIPFFQDYYDFPTYLEVCSRSGDVIEPMAKPQWYLKCSGDMARNLLEQVMKSKITIVPSNNKLFGKESMIEWLSNLKDWCLSRQIWWGHRIPAFYFTDPDVNGNLKRIVHDKSTPIHQSNDITYIIASNNDQAYEKAFNLLNNTTPYKSLVDFKECVKIFQDEDVFDTWFSSALYPLGLSDRLGHTNNLILPDIRASNHGVGTSLIKNNNNDYRYQCPLSLMETGFDIRHLWVTRLLLLGLELTGTLPFNEILYHGIVNDTYGRKMSKSLGNVVDPVDVINGASLKDLRTNLLSDTLSDQEKEKALKGQKQMFPNGIPACGADALKFALLHSNIKSQVVKIDVSRIAEFRKLGNKIWQAARYYFHALSKLDDTIGLRLNHEEPVSIGNVEDLWILSRLDWLIEKCHVSLNGSKKEAVRNDDVEESEKYDFHLAAEALRHFWLEEFCDVYIESSKAILFNQDPDKRCIDSMRSTLFTLHACLNLGLRLTHPFMPHITEALWFYTNKSNINPFVNDLDPQLKTLPLGLLTYPEPGLLNLQLYGDTSIKTNQAGEEYSPGNTRRVNTRSRFSG
ncbi:unnamed protein product [Gordionus sp. m RMFG-2023]